MMDSNNDIKICSGLYLVLDPSIEKSVLFSKLRSALEGGVNILQVWNNWPIDFEKHEKASFINQIVEIAQPFNVPVLINQEWELINDTKLSGVHFDAIPNNYEQIKINLDRDLIIGVTSGNDLKIVEWAEQNNISYISFCALFPSKSAGVCEIVTQETIIRAKRITSIPIFISGGITATNLLELKDLGLSGAAVISGVLESEFPALSSQEYIESLNKIIK